MMGDMDLPAGPPSRPGATSSFMQPLHVLERMGAEQRERDAEEVNRFFTCAAPVVPDHIKQAIKNAICPPKSRTDGEQFTALRRIDNPDAKAELCGKNLKCKHTCEEPKVVPHQCGLFCSAIKQYIRTCGHETQIYCYRDGATSATPCKAKCSKLVSCGHACRKSCHFNEPCPPTCEDFYCKNTHLDNIMGRVQPMGGEQPSRDEW